jgi:hypothetical protein
LERFRRFSSCPIKTSAWVTFVNVETFLSDELVLVVIDLYKDDLEIE